MSNFYKLDFYLDRDGGVCLSFEDSLHGEDEEWIIQPDGDVFPSLGGELLPPYEAVNLHTELAKLLKKLQGGDRS